MPEEKKRGARGAKGGAGAKAGGEKEDRRRIGYLKMRGRELKKEAQANREEMEALRAKLGMGARGNKKKGQDAGGDDDDE